GLEDNYAQRGNHPGLRGLARLKDGVSLERASGDMNVIAERLEQQYPKENAGHRVRVRGLKDVIVGGIRPALLVLLGAGAFVLLIACGNVANLTVGRAASRDKEIAIRAALGAGRARLVRQLMTESLILAVTGGALSMVLAIWGVKLIIAVNPDSIPRVKEIGLDWRVVGFT